MGRFKEGRIFFGTVQIGGIFLDRYKNRLNICMVLNVNNIMYVFDSVYFLYKIKLIYIYITCVIEYMNIMWVLFNSKWCMYVLVMFLK